MAGQIVVRGDDARIEAADLSADGEGGDAVVGEDALVGREVEIAGDAERADGRRDDYLQAAADLRADLTRIDGFISVERFQSLTNPDKLLSLSIWRD